MTSCTAARRQLARSGSEILRQRRRSHCSVSALAQSTVGVAALARQSASSSRHGPASHHWART